MNISRDMKKLGIRLHDLRRVQRSISCMIIDLVSSHMLSMQTFLF
jgi:hypothetical protein